MTLTAGSLSLSPGLTGSYPAVAADGNGFPVRLQISEFLCHRPGPPAGGRPLHPTIPTTCSWLHSKQKMLNSFSIFCFECKTACFSINGEVLIFTAVMDIRKQDIVTFNDSRSYHRSARLRHRNNCANYHLHTPQARICSVH